MPATARWRSPETESTRSGVIAERNRGSRSHCEVVADTPVGLTIRAFELSPKPMSWMTALPSPGEARYTGQTFAVGQGGHAFSGTIN